MTIMKTYSCPKHGDQGNFVGVEVVLTSHTGPLPESLKPRASRRYCMACWVDLMDREMEQLVEQDHAPDQVLSPGYVGEPVKVLAEATDGGDGSKYAEWTWCDSWCDPVGFGHLSGELAAPRRGWFHRVTSWLTRRANG